MTARKILTPEEKEIRAEERRSMAALRRAKINLSKKLKGMTDEEIVAYFQRKDDELRAMGFNLVDAVE